MRKKRTSKLTKNKRLIILVAIGLVLIIGTTLTSNKLIKNNQEVIEPVVTSNYMEDNSIIPEEVAPVQEKNTAEPKPAPTSEPTSQWPVTYSLEQSSSVTVVVNKKHKLPSDYVPLVTTASGATMRPEAIEALRKLMTDAQNTGVPMKVLSSYRSYSTQVSTYNRWVNQSGQAAADTFSARPGHSEHQLGLAVDLGELDSTACDLETCFGNTPAGQWLASNAQYYGFIIRYPEGKDSITGYQYEPWHLRYIGINEAIAVINSGQTLDQYYGVEAGGY